VIRLASERREFSRKEAADLGNGIAMDFVLIPAGSFKMGSEEIPDAQPVHKVRIAQPFYMGKTRSLRNSGSG
jgi:formylglycine-generating enzyme required for sulfatase activity